ncbi:hypothetical protein AVEN_26829-1 [Araneus ventricosus]|uniref:Innexin n=1 Tax=Araneus ventricosus TaxID=182803 RepID=A0A4Y2KJU5_ARAVE|nr:hypothetical protein AVEN_26829-1 [Araneus ventricosus]
MAAGGFILYAKYVMSTPFLRTSEDYIPSDLYDTICSKNSSITGLPTEWFEEINDEMLGADSGRYVGYCLMVLIYTICFSRIKKLWSEKEGGRVGELIPLVTSIILPNDNKEERKKAIVRLMISKISAHESYFLYFVFVNSLYFLLGLCGLILNPVNPFAYQDLAVRLNGSEWTVDCDRQATSRDAYILIKCPIDGPDKKFRRTCIVSPATYFHVQTGVSLLFAILAILCALFLIWSSCEIWYFGLRRMNDILLVRLLKKNVDYTQHKEIIDAFERKLDERRRASLEMTRSIEQAGEAYNRVRHFRHFLPFL